MTIREILNDQLRYTTAIYPTPGTVEHGYQRGLLNHESVLRVESHRWLLILMHPEACGCDALTDELVLHG